MGKWDENWMRNVIFGAEFGGFGLNFRAAQDFLTRQRTFELAKQKRMDLRAQIQDTECSFQPTLKSIFLMVLMRFWMFWVGINYETHAF